MSNALTNRELEEELLDLRTEQDSSLVKARGMLHDLLLADIQWWYDQAKLIARTGDSRRDQTKQAMICKMLDKIMPDRKEISRGAAKVRAGQVIFNMAGAEPAKAPKNVTPVNGADPAQEET